MSADPYSPTDLRDAPGEWLHVLRPKRTWRPGGPGRPPCHVRRSVNGMLSVNKTGCHWRLVPKACGPWRTLYGDCKRWRRAGVWARLMETRRQWERRGLGRQPAPSAGRLDAQPIQTTTQSEEVGVEGGKQSNGRTRHLVVDPLGVLLAVVGTSAETAARLG